MAAAPVHFNDAELYEDFMGPWTRSVGATFLAWFAPPDGLNWLDVGCGTGAFTELVIDTCSPASMIGVDPSNEQVEYTRSLPLDHRAEFHVSGAEALPFPDNSFDVVASALVINFVADRPRALAEMQRVARPDGAVGGYVWDFPSGRGVSWPLERGFKATGIEPPEVPGKEDSSVEALQCLFEAAGFNEIDGRRIRATRTFADFEEYWRSQLPPFSPFGRHVAALPDSDRTDLAKNMRTILPIADDGRITYEVCASAVKARAPA